MNEARNYIFERILLIYLLMLNPRYSSVEKAKFMGISNDAISKSYRRFLNRLKSDESMKKNVEQMREEMYG